MVALEKMSDNAESPTETQKEESQPPSDESTNEEKKKSKRRFRFYYKINMLKNAAVKRSPGV